MRRQILQTLQNQRELEGAWLRDHAYSAWPRNHSLTHSLCIIGVTIPLFTGSESGSEEGSTVIVRSVVHYFRPRGRPLLNPFFRFCVRPGRKYFRQFCSDECQAKEIIQQWLSGRSTGLQKPASCLTFLRILVMLGSHQTPTVHMRICGFPSHYNIKG